MTLLITLHDVEPAVRLNAQLEALGHKTLVVSPLDDLRGEIKRAKPELIVVTGELNDAAIVSIVHEQLWAGVPTVGLTDLQDEQALARLRALGYVELFQKPVDAEELAAVIQRILDRRALQQETGLIGESEALREVLVKIEQMAPVSSTVLVEGESGTGKELVARGLHRLSSRKNKPFIAVNVGALAETLLESELFGHEKGAFTGAAERRIGRFELADTGTIFLDEIGDIPPATQVKLLRVLEEREFLRVGGTVPIQVDVRVITATNRPLRQQVEEATFRPDLFYRLNVLNIHLPPLRQRAGDVPHLVRKFVADFSREHERPFHGISAEAMRLLVEYPWPGNVRELRNLVESMVVLAPGHEIMPDDLPRQIREGGSARWLPVPVSQATRAQAAASAEGRELEFILRSILELRLQVEDLRRRIAEGDPRIPNGDFIGEVWSPAGGGDGSGAPGSRAVTDGGGAGAGEESGWRAMPVAPLRPRNAAPPPNVVVVEPGTKLEDIERRVIEAALKETRGNRRRAAEMLGIGERTLYRKIKEYELPDGVLAGT